MEKGEREMGERERQVAKREREGRWGNGEREMGCTAVNEFVRK